MTKISTLDTGFQPDLSPLTEQERKRVFLAIVMLKRRIRGFASMSKIVAASLKRLEGERALAKQAADIGAMTRIDREIDVAKDGAKEIRQLMRDSGDGLLDVVCLLDDFASLHEKAVLLSISDRLAERVAKECESERFMVLLMQLPKDRGDTDIEDALIFATIRRITGHPIAHRLVNQRMNEILGQDVFELPPRPRPTVVR